MTSTGESSSLPPNNRSEVIPDHIESLPFESRSANSGGGRSRPPPAREATGIPQRVHALAGVQPLSSNECVSGGRVAVRRGGVAVEVTRAPSARRRGRTKAAQGPPRRSGGRGVRGRDGG